MVGGNVFCLMDAIDLYSTPAADDEDADAAAAPALVTTVVGSVSDKTSVAVTADDAGRLDAVTLSSCAMRTCSRKLYLFLNFLRQCSHWRCGCGVCCVRICLHRLTVVITTLQN